MLPIVFGLGAVALGAAAIEESAYPPAEMSAESREFRTAVGLPPGTAILKLHTDAALQSRERAVRKAARRYLKAVKAFNAITFGADPLALPPPSGAPLGVYPVAADTAGKLHPAVQSALDTLKAWFDALGPRVVTYDARTGQARDGSTYVVVRFTADDPLRLIEKGTSLVRGVGGISVTTKPVMSNPRELDFLITRGAAPQLDEFGFDPAFDDEGYGLDDEEDDEFAGIFKKGGGGGGKKPLKAVGKVLGAPFRAIGKAAKKKEGGGDKKKFKPFKILTSPFRAVGKAIKKGKDNRGGRGGGSVSSGPTAAVFPWDPPAPAPTRVAWAPGAMPTPIAVPYAMPNLAPLPSIHAPASVAMPMQAAAVMAAPPPAVPLTRRQRKLTKKQLRQQKRGIGTTASLAQAGIKQQLKAMKKPKKWNFGDQVGDAVAEDMFG